MGRKTSPVALLLRPVVPAAQQREMVAELGHVRSGFGVHGERVDGGAGAIFGGERDRGLRLGLQWDGREHQRLREEAAADCGLLADSANAEGGEAFGAAELAVLEEEDGGGFGANFVLNGCSFLEDEGAQLVDGADEFVGEQGGGADFFPLLMQRGCAFEVHCLAGGYRAARQPRRAGIGRGW